ncbi:MAG: site-specific integrase, partial [Bacteroidales bacterium]|nr:site-specific integrase [Bacteroidales bacterium]
MAIANKPDLEPFAHFLRVERSLSPHTVAAYRRDITKLAAYLETHHPGTSLEAADTQLLREFLQCSPIPSASSQARLISGLRTYYRYLLMVERIKENPMELIASPKLRRKLPQVPSFQEIEAMENSFDLSKPENFRNKTILELMYSCGLRVSEVVALPLSALHL